MLDTLSPYPNTFDGNKCALIIIELGFCRIFGCDNKIAEKKAKYAPLIATLKKKWS